MILVTGHMGNYDAVRANLIHRGYNMGALYRRMSNPYFNEHYVRSISRIGTPLFEQGRKGMIEMVRHIRSGGILGILTDLYAKQGKPLDFSARRHAHRLSPPNWRSNSTPPDPGLRSARPGRDWLSHYCA